MPLLKARTRCCGGRPEEGRFDLVVCLDLKVKLYDRTHADW
jgi:hypothetical protein